MDGIPQPFQENDKCGRTSSRDSQARLGTTSPELRNPRHLWTMTEDESYRDVPVEWARAITSRSVASKYLGSIVVQTPILIVTVCACVEKKGGGVTTVEEHRM